MTATKTNRKKTKATWEVVKIMQDEKSRKKENLSVIFPERKKDMVPMKQQ